MSYSKYTISTIKAAGIEILNWPSHSQDLSPIEKIWSILKSKVYEHGHFHDKTSLWSKIQNEAPKIKINDPDLFRKLYTRFYKSMCLAFHAQEVNLSNKCHFIIIKFVYVTFF